MCVRVCVCARTFIYPLFFIIIIIIKNNIIFIMFYYLLLLLLFKPSVLIFSIVFINKVSKLLFFKIVNAIKLFLLYIYIL